MRTSLSISVLCGLSALLVGLSSWPTTPSAVAQDEALPQKQVTKEPVTVHLASGRTFTAVVDPRTDATRLWLRWERGSAVLQRPINWDRVVRAEVAGGELSGEQFHRIVETIRREGSIRAETAVAREQSRISRSPDAARSVAAAASTMSSRVRATSKVRSMAIDAEVANWDADVEVDGLLVRVFPLDAYGALVPVSGTLEVDLQGRRHGAATHPRSFLRLGRWTRRVRPGDFGPGGAAYRLPFQSIHPEFDFAIASQGAVHARLGVPGQGVFETTESMVRIRPYSAIRDQWQQATGRRFFPQERTGRGQR